MVGNRRRGIGRQLVGQRTLRALPVQRPRREQGQAREYEEAARPREHGGGRGTGGNLALANRYLTARSVGPRFRVFHEADLGWDEAAKVLRLSL